jgi:hypothetical protein
MLKDASRRKLDVVIAWAIDLLGRSLIDLLRIANSRRSTLPMWESIARKLLRMCSLDMAARRSGCT